MSDQPMGPGWWIASDGKWYPPEQYPDEDDEVEAAPATSEAKPAQEPTAATPITEPEPTAAVPETAPEPEPETEPTAAMPALTPDPTLVTPRVDPTIPVPPTDPTGVMPPPDSASAVPPLPPGEPPLGPPPGPPPAVGTPSGGGGSKKGLIAAIVVVLALLGAAGAYLLLSDDDDERTATTEESDTDTSDSSTDASDTDTDSDGVSDPDSDTDTDSDGDSDTDSPFRTTTTRDTGAPDIDAPPGFQVVGNDEERFAIALPEAYEVIDLSAEDLDAIQRELEATNPELARAFEQAKAAIAFGGKLFAYSTDPTEPGTTFNLIVAPFNLDQVESQAIQALQSIGATNVVADDFVTAAGDAVRVAYNLVINLPDGTSTTLNGVQYYVDGGYILTYSTISQGLDDIFDTSAETFDANP